MARKDQAVELLRRGLPPSEIARQMNTSGAVVMQYLCLKIGEGELRRSDLAFSIPRELRIAIEVAIEATRSTHSGVITRAVRRAGIAADRLDIGVYLHYRRARVVLGDMYELLRTIEVRLHAFIKQAFIAEFGEENWWRGGVPDDIRAECAALSEKDPEPAGEPYCYTHLISLREILNKRWAVLSKYMAPALVNNKKDLLERLLKLNRIRNSVMHPVRHSALSEDDFEFVRDLECDLRELQVQSPPKHEQTPLADEIQAAETEPTPHELVSALTPVGEDTPADEDSGGGIDQKAA